MCRLTPNGNLIILREPPQKKEQEKVDNEKNKELFDTHLFNALKAKSLENYAEALEHFEKCIKLDQNNPLPFYESAIINTANGSYALAI